MPNPNLPPEILDYIVDIHHDRLKTLRRCCLVAKSWVPRARRHLFAKVEFFSVKHLEAWKKTFPDPSNSPARHTHTLLIYCPDAVTAADAEDGGWIQAFSRLEYLNVGDNVQNSTYSKASLAPFRRFLPTLKSLRVSCIWLPNAQIPDLVGSLPLLEDLALLVHGTENDDLKIDGPPTAIQPSTSPVFTGTLELTLLQDMTRIARWLLDLPNGLHFRKFRLTWPQEGYLRWINALVAECSDTLESLSVTHHAPGTITRPLRWNQRLTPVCTRKSETRVD